MSDQLVTDADSRRLVVELFAAEPAGARPDLVADLGRDAAVVGLGISTREGHETLRFVDDTTRLLLEGGFAVIAVLDNQRVVELYDRYAAGEDIDIDHALSQAWGPWRTVEMRQALTWVREHNRTRPTDPVRIVGVGSSRVLASDYDRIIEHLAGVDPSTASKVKDVLDVIRVAHSSGEHVLLARGLHPGPPFVELARTARDTVAAMEPAAGRDKALLLLQAVVDFHANAIGVGYDWAREERAAADLILDHCHRTGKGIVLWEGSAHVAAQPQLALGSHLRTALGQRYVAVHIGFSDGRIARADIPKPRADSIEALLDEAGGARTVNLRAQPPTPASRQLTHSWSTRLISGVYDPAHDAEHYLELPSLSESFDVLVHIPTITPAHALPTQ